MVKTFGRIFPYCCIAAFILHWVLVLVLALPPRLNSKITALSPPRIKTMFSSWRLFTPPYTYHQRLYFIIKDTTRNDNTDTLEVLEPLAKQKRASAPFNQKESNIDHLVNNNASGLLRTVWEYKKIPGEAFSSSSDATYISSTIASVKNSRNYQLYLATLYNYCKLVLKEHHISESGKVVKIIIRKKMIRPFKDINDLNDKQPEILVFENAFTTLKP